MKKDEFHNSIIDVSIDKHWLEKIEKFGVDEFKKLPQELHNEDFYIQLIKQSPYLFKKIPKIKGLYLKAVKIEGLLLEHCSEKSEKLCLEAVKQNGLAIQFVPKHFKSKALLILSCNFCFTFDN